MLRQLFFFQRSLFFERELIANYFATIFDKNCGSPNRSRNEEIKYVMIIKTIIEGQWLLKMIFVMFNFQ